MFSSDVPLPCDESVDLRLNKPYASELTKLPASKWDGYNYLGHRTPGTYQIPCQCRWCYIGQTGNTMLGQI